MARMIPAVVGDETSSPGEKELFKRFLAGPGTDGWAILHSLDIPRHRRQLMGEIDFVIAVPHQGVLCLEVKSHRTVRRAPDGLWHLGQDPPTPRGPFRQASEATHSLREFVTKRAPQLGGILFWSAVCFTHVPFTLSFPAEWHEWQVIDSADLRARPLSELIRAVLAHARSLAVSRSNGWFDSASQQPTEQQIETLVKTLRPSFEFFESPKSRRRQRDDELLHYTTEQFVALDAMTLNPRVVFEGAAGTGKTLLALEETRRSVLRGHTVLLCCFNRLLGRWLKKEAEPFGATVTATTFHRYLLGVSGLEVPEGNATSFWEQDVADGALERILAPGFKPFDVLIVDEAQDLLRESYLDIFDAVLTGGLAGGQWRLFGDFVQQAIYGSSNLSIADVLTSRAVGTPRFVLTKNCRNTPRIASFVKLIAGYKGGYRDILRPDNGLEPETIYFDSLEDQGEKLTRLLDRLFTDGYSGKEIVILSPRNEGGAAQRITLPPWSDRLKSADVERPSGILHCTIQAFKGLEAPVVIVTDITSIGSDEDNSLFYVAVTRAVERLYVLASNKVKPAVLELLLRQATSESPQ